MSCRDAIRWPGAAGTVLGTLAAMGVLSAGSPVQGGIIPCTHEFEGDVLTSQGLIHPAVLVGFNPQPEPPAAPAFDVTDPTEPMVGWSNDENSYLIVFGFKSPVGATPPDDNRVAFDTSLQSVPDADGKYRFGVEVTPPDSATPSLLFDVFLEVVATEGTFDRASWAGFNPQPEPPGYEGKTIGFEFDVTPNSPTAVTLAFSIQDRETGNLATLTEIPEPASAATMLAGVVAGALGLRRSRLSGPLGP